MLLWGFGWPAVYHLALLRYQKRLYGSIIATYIRTQPQHPKILDTWFLHGTQPHLVTTHYALYENTVGKPVPNLGPRGLGTVWPEELSNN